jgi:hypothetical protein
MKTRHIASVIAAGLLTVGLIPLGSASEVTSFPEGIEVLTVVGKRLSTHDAFATRAAPEGIEVITVVGKRPSLGEREVLTAVGARPVPEGIEVITVIGKLPEPTVTHS